MNILLGTLDEERIPADYVPHKIKRSLHIMIIVSQDTGCSLFTLNDGECTMSTDIVENYYCSHHVLDQGLLEPGFCGSDQVLQSTF